MNLIELFKNKLFRIVGIIVIVYFALFHDNNAPDGLVNRASPNKIKEQISKAASIGENIAIKVSNAKQQVAAPQMIDKTEQSAEEKLQIPTQDIKIGEGDRELACLDEAMISYKILSNKDQSQISSGDPQSLIIGRGSVSFIENNIIGMKEGGVRNIILPESFKINDSVLQRILENNSGLTYQVTLLKFHKSNLDQAINCN